MSYDYGFLPNDAAAATLVGRIFDPGADGPVIVTVDGSDFVDITDLGPTVSDLFERENTAGLVQDAAKQPHRARFSIASVAASSLPDAAANALRMLSPVDLQVVKAAGVTFVDSMIERVIEERAQGNADLANELRAQLSAVIGDEISNLKPGSEEARAAKAVLQEKGLWSPYLEVGIGPDPEVFTKAPVLSTVGWGEQVGIREDSTWNNPEPEVVFAVRSDGVALGAMLGNDVNLRDIEGRSALLLGEAKDNNASCAIGPMIRLFDENFTMDDTRALEVSLRVEGSDGFVMEGKSSMRRISRDPADLIGKVRTKSHQYPDGFVLFTGTHFAPTQDRGTVGAGFTHSLGDVVTISTPQLGALVNTVNHSNLAPEWVAGIRALYANLSSRGFSLT